MNIRVEELSKEQFSSLSGEAYFAAFLEKRDSSIDRYSYALLCINDKEEVTAYSTVLEFDAESAYMQHGGKISDNAMYTVKSYFLMIEWLKKKYKTISTRIFNENIKMLNLAMKAGLRIIGVEYYKDTNEILLNLRLENKGETI